MCWEVVGWGASGAAPRTTAGGEVGFCTGQRPSRRQGLAPRQTRRSYDKHSAAAAAPRQLPIGRTHRAPWGGGRARSPPPQTGEWAQGELAPPQTPHGAEGARRRAPLSMARRALVMAHQHNPQAMLRGTRGVRARVVTLGFPNALVIRKTLERARRAVAAGPEHTCMHVRARGRQFPQEMQDFLTCDRFRSHSRHRADGPWHASPRSVPQGHDHLGVAPREGEVIGSPHLKRSDRSASPEAPRTVRTVRGRAVGRCV